MQKFLLTLLFISLFSPIASLAADDNIKYSVQFFVASSEKKAKKHLKELPNALQKRAFIYPIKGEYAIRIGKKKKKSSLYKLRETLIASGYIDAWIAKSDRFVIKDSVESLKQKFRLVPLSRGSYENLAEVGDSVSEGLYQLRIQISAFSFPEKVQDINLFLVLPEGTKVLKRSSTINGRSIPVKKVDNLHIYSPSWVSYKDKIDLSMVLSAEEDAKINHFSYILYGKNAAGKTLFIEAIDLPSIKRQTFALYTSAKIFVIEDKKGKKKRKVNFKVVPLMKASKHNLIKGKNTLDAGLYQAKLQLNYLFKKRQLEKLRIYFELPENAEIIPKTARHGKEMVELKKMEDYYVYEINNYNGDNHLNFGVVFSTTERTEPDEFAFSILATDESGKQLSYSKKKFQDFKSRMKEVYSTPQG
jgi:hypothetical protein